MENCLRADADGLTGSNARTASTRLARTVGDSVRTTFGRRKNTRVRAPEIPQQKRNTPIIRFGRISLVSTEDFETWERSVRFHLAECFSARALPEYWETDWR